MKFATVAVLAVLLAVPLVAGLSPGGVVSSGAPFPIVADFNGDGLDDLIQETTVVLNHGGALTEVRDLNLGGEKVVGVLDANGDGVLDLLTEGSQVMVPPSLGQPGALRPIGYRLYVGTADRTYKSSIPISSGARPYVADVNADGKDDIVVMAGVFTNGVSTATDVTVLRSRGDGTFDQLETFRMPADPQIYPDDHVLTGDLNHDGIPDLVVRCAQDLVVLRGTGNGAFAVESRHLPLGPAFAPQSARLGDVDGDSNLDVILPSHRGIRVFFGDGRGNFPRTSRAPITKVHDLQLPPELAFIAPKSDINEPRDLALGHFTRSDRTQIAAGTLEGDIVVFSWEQGALREVSRTPTEFWHLDLRAGAFSRSGLNDIYAMGTLIWGDMYPRPRVFNGEAEATASSVSIGSPRRRAARSGPADTMFEMEMRGECIDEAAASWSFTRDGIFGVAKRGATTIEAVFDAPSLYFRLTAPYAQGPATGVLTEENGAYRGSVQVVTSCGVKTLTITASPK